jgi:hypothetical protein
MAAPIASGWSESPGGPRTHWKAPPFHGARRLRPSAALGSAYGQLVEHQCEGVTEIIWGAALLYTVEPMTSEPLPRAVRPEYLTEALRRAGALGDGRVVNVVVQSSKATIISRIIRLSLSYDGFASGAPNSLNSEDEAARTC